MSQPVKFEKLNNTRDLGGMAALDGHIIRPGMLFRSGHISDLTEGDVEKLSGIVRTVVDFRSDDEREKQPDRRIPGVENIHIPIVASLTPGVTREKEADENVFKRYLLKPDEAKVYMCGLYREFTADFAVSQYSRFLKILTAGEGPVLWHCTAGKDRAGIASVIVEEILGVGRDDIMEDYLLTNEYIRKDIAFLTDFVKKQAGTDSSAADEALQYLFGAKDEYLMAFYDAVDEKYGDMESFIIDGLGVDIRQMRDKYLESV